MIINHNMNAMNAHRLMMGNTAEAGKSMEKLSSGLRINRAGDDAAGLAISEKMRAQIRGLDQAQRNSQDGISMIQTAEGALNETHSILQRMRELATQSANDTNVTVDRKEIQKEMNQLTSEINRIGNTTEFNTQNVLKGGTKKAETAVAGEYTLKVADATKGVTVDGETIGASTGMTLATLAGKLTANASLGAKYTFTAGTTNIVIKQAANKESAKAPTVTDGALTTVKAGAAVGDEIPDGDFKATLQIGANEGQAFEIEIKDMRAAALGISGKIATAPAQKDQTVPAGAIFSAENNVTAGTDNSPVEGALDVSDHTKASAAIKVINNAIESVSAERSKLGAYQNRLEHTINNLGTASENLTASESRIRDVDMANEMMSFSKKNILAQAAQAMLAQANQQPQGVLQLLR